MILGIVVQSVSSYHVCSVVVFFSWHVCNLYLLNDQAMFGLLQLNVATDKASSFLSFLSDCGIYPNLSSFFANY